MITATSNDIMAAVGAVAAKASRRSILAGTGLAALTAAIALPAVAAPAPDPVVAMFARWRTLEDQIETSDRECSELRAACVSAYGEVLGGDDGDLSGWRADPRNAELRRLNVINTGLCDESLEITDAMMETAATSLEGLRCKFIVALEVLKFLEWPNAEPPEYHERMAVAFLRDGVRLLGGSAVA